MNSIKLENKKACAKCGGMCCKKSGCDYFVSDFPIINKEVIKKILDKGNTSIVAALHFSEDSNDKITCEPFLYLRARNNDREVIDLFSMKKQCSMLTPKGCRYDKINRPGGGLNLIPKRNIFTGELSCYPLRSQLDEVNKWAPYQNLLKEMVEIYTGLNVYDKLSEDVENIFYQLFVRNFEGISLIEIKDIVGCLDLLYLSFSKEYDKALARYNNMTSNTLVRKRDK